MQGISKNEVVVRKGHTLLAQLLCAGEFKAPSTCTRTDWPT